MTVMDKGRDLECVPLLHAVDKIRTRCCNGDLTKAREIVKDLDIRILRPDGTQARLRAVANLWDNPDLWEELFRTGLFDAPARRPLVWGNAWTGPRNGLKGYKLTSTHANEG